MRMNSVEWCSYTCVSVAGLTSLSLAAPPCGFHLSSSTSSATTSPCPPMALPSLRYSTLWPLLMRFNWIMLWTHRAAWWSSTGLLRFTVAAVETEQICRNPSSACSFQKEPQECIQTLMETHRISCSEPEEFFTQKTIVKCFSVEVTVVLLNVGRTLCHSEKFRPLRSDFLLRHLVIMGSGLLA